MKFNLCLLAAIFAAVSYGWGLGDALKAVDKATTTVNDANNAVKAVTQKPEQVTTGTATATDVTAGVKNEATTQAASVAPSAASTSAASTSTVYTSTLKWDAAGYAAKLAKVNAAMPAVMKKMPLRGEQDQWYNAAYQFTNIDRQYSFMKPEQRVARINPNMQGKVDKFLAWVEGGMQTASANCQHASTAPVQNTAVATPGTQYDANNRVELRMQCQKQLEAAKSAGEISLQSRNEINQWLCIQINSVNDAASESQYKKDFEQKVAAAKDNQQQSGSANVQTSNQLSGGIGNPQLSNVLTDAEETKFRKECMDIIEEALTHKEYELDRKSLESDTLDLIDQEKKIQGHVGRAKAEMVKNRIHSRIDVAKANYQHRANENMKKLNPEIERLHQIIKECDDLAKKCDDALKEYDGKAGAVAKLLPESVKKAQQDRVDKLLAAYGGRGGRGGASVELPKDDPFKAEVMMLFPADVTSYTERKKKGAYGDSDNVEDIQNKVTALETLKGKMNQAVVGEYGFVRTCTRVASDMEKYAGDALKNAEAEFRFVLDNSGKVFTDPERESRNAEIQQLKTTLSQGEYVTQLMAKTVDLKKEIQAFKEKQSARERVVDKIRYSSASDWQKAVDAEKEEKDKKGLLKDLLSARGADEKFCKDPVAVELFNKYFTFTDIVDSMRNEKDLSGFWLGAGLFITDQKILKDILITNDAWVRSWRDGIPTMSRESLYYGLYKNVTEQAVLMQLLDVKEINFDSMGINSYGHRDRAVFSLLNANNLKLLDKKREARRIAVKGQIIDCRGFYIGMPQRDFLLLEFEKEEKGKGDVSGGFDGDCMSPMESIVFDAKMRYEYLGIKKDGLEGLAEFVEKYVEGGNDSVGSTKIDASTNTSWFYVDSPKFDCQIMMYKDGDLRIRSTRDLGESHKLDFSKAK